MLKDTLTQIIVANPNGTKTEHAAAFAAAVEASPSLQQELVTTYFKGKYRSAERQGRGFAHVSARRTRSRGGDQDQSQAGRGPASQSQSPRKAKAKVLNLSCLSRPATA